jgi:hypothetical protein
LLLEIEISHHRVRREKLEKQWDYWAFINRFVEVM